MNRQEFEELELQVQQSELPLQPITTGVENVPLPVTVSNKSWLLSVLNRHLLSLPKKNNYRMVLRCCFPMDFVPTSGAVLKIC